MSGSILEETPPPSPTLSDAEAEVISRPGSSPDLAGLLSDVSLPSDEDEKELAMTPEPPDEEEIDSGFQDITKSMLGSTIDRDADVASIHSEDEDTAKKSTPKQSLRNTPSASMAVLGSEPSFTPRSLQSSQSFHYPDPQSDGSGIFGLSKSPASMTDGATFDTDQSMMNSPPGGATPTVKTQPRLADSMLSEDSDKASDRRLARIRELRSSLRQKAKMAKERISQSDKEGVKASEGRMRPSHQDRTISTTDSTRSGLQLTPKHGYRWPTISAFGAVGFFFALAMSTYHASVGVHTDITSPTSSVLSPASELPYLATSPITVAAMPAETGNLASVTTTALAERSSNTDLIALSGPRQLTSKRRKLGTESINAADVVQSPRIKFERLEVKGPIRSSGDSKDLEDLFYAKGLRRRARQQKKKDRGVFASLPHQAVSYSTLLVKDGYSQSIKARSPLPPISCEASHAGTCSSPTDSDQARKTNGLPDDVELPSEDDLFLLPLAGPIATIKVLPDLDFDAFKRWLQDILSAYRQQVASVGEAGKEEANKAIAAVDASIVLMLESVHSLQIALRIELEQIVETLRALGHRTKGWQQAAIRQQRRATRKASRNARRLVRFLRR